MNEDYRENVNWYAALTTLGVGALIYFMEPNKEKAAKYIVLSIIPSMVAGGMIGAYLTKNKK